MSLSYQRAQAAKAIYDRIIKWGDTPAPVSDKAVDELARQILNLPPSPEKQEPYGWILPENKQNINVHLKDNLNRREIIYLSQLDNQYNPKGSCLLTCAAMVALTYGIKPDNKDKRLSDEFYEYFISRKLDRTNHYRVQEFLEQIGIDDQFSTDTPWNEVKAHLDKNYPVIISGKFTKSGHIIVLTEYDENGFRVHDPYGEWFETGYRTDLCGKDLGYSYELIFAKSYGGSKTTWAHLVKGNRLSPTGNRQESDGLKPVIGIENTTPQFQKKVKAIASNLKLDPNWLMACMSFETGGTFSPSVRNKVSGATGLIQFMRETADGLGTSIEALAKMDAILQLDWVEKYFQPYKGRIKSLEDCYMAILWPSAIGKGSNHVLFSGNKAYQQNAGLDINKDGSITVLEATEKVRARFI